MPELTLYQKSILATALLAIALVQLALIAFGRGWAGGFAPELRRWLVRMHHLGGYLGFFVVLLVAYSCVVYIGARLSPPRVAVHGLLGAAIITLIMSKIVVARGLRQYYHWLPVLGAALFTAIIASWFLSAGWYFYVEGF
jgi:hypothetical protein